MRAFFVILSLFFFATGIGFTEDTKGKRIADIKRVLLTPQSATIWIVEKRVLNPEDKKIDIELPPQALTDSFGVEIVEPQELRIVNIVEDWKAERTEKEINELMEKIKALEKEINLLEATKRSLSFELESWEAHGRYKRDKLHEAVQFLEESKKRSNELNKQILQVTYDIKDRNEALETLRQRYNEMTGETRKAKIIRCLLSEHTKDKEITLKYHYTIREAFWKPFYRIEVFPSQEKMRFSMEGEVLQRSGTDWNGVDLEIATAEVASSLIPPELPPWIIQPSRPRFKMAGSSDKANMMPMPAAPVETHASEEEKPVEKEEKVGFALFKLHSQHIPSGKNAIIGIFEEEWKAQITYLLRPFISERAYIQAEVDFKEPLQFPEGQALVFSEGSFIGKMGMSIHGLKKTFYFGKDPLISSKMFIEEKETGHKGFIQGKKSFTWKWHYEVENGHDFPVTIRLEERKPFKTDESIKVSILEFPNITPLNDDNPNLWVWEFQMKEREKRKLNFRIQVEAPENMEVNPGWK